MKILLVNDNLDDAGGAERSFHATADLLRQHGHEVAVLGGQGGETPGSLVSRWFSLNYLRRAERLIAEIGAELIHCHNLTRVVSPSPMLAARRAGIPVVLTLRDPHLFCATGWGVTRAGGTCPRFSPACLMRCQRDREGLRWLPWYTGKYLKVSLQRRLIRRWCAHYICPSHALQTLLLRNFPETVGSHTILPNFFLPQMPRAAEPDPHRFLFVGRVTRAKGLDIALEAVAILAGREQYRHIRLDVVGDGPCLADAKRRAAALGIAERVAFLGALPHKDLAAHYLRCCAVLMPSVWIENNPRVALEAMQWQRPVIASRHAGFLELVDDGRSGFLFNTGEAGDLAQSMASLYGQREMSRLFGAAGRARLEKEFSPEAHYQALAALYTRVRDDFHAQRRHQSQPA